jgi:DNA-binding GntR family transcriptional regulator
MSSAPVPNLRDDLFASIAITVPENGHSRGSMPDAVADALREAILDGTLEPGTWLREAEVARKLKVSRTPVRDALRSLANESLVELKTNQGAVVSAMNIDDIIELYVIRASLEALATGLAARRSASACAAQFADLIPRMREAKANGALPELAEMNHHFHEIVCDASGNRYLQRSLSHLQTASRRFPHHTLDLPGRSDESLQEHLDIADAIIRADVAAAERLAGEHIRHLSELRIQMLLGH